MTTDEHERAAEDDMDHVGVVGPVKVFNRRQADGTRQHLIEIDHAKAEVVRTPKAFANVSPRLERFATTLGSTKYPVGNAESVGYTDDTSHGSPTLSAFPLFSFYELPRVEATLGYN